MTAGGELAAAFAERAAVLGTQVVSADLQGLQGVLREVIGGDALGVGVSSDLLRLLPELGELRRDEGDWPAVAITRARFGIAATGSVAIADDEHRDRLLALLCFRHVVLLPASSLLVFLADAAPILSRWVDTGGHRYVTFASGPSRTSDIERVLTIGVHGPRELVVVLVQGWELSDDA
jgi:L-lactate dehydrogenase complex protein LldG